MIVTAYSVQTIVFEESAVMFGATGYTIATSVVLEVHAELQVDEHGNWRPVVSRHDPYGNLSVSTPKFLQPYHVVVESVNPELKAHEMSAAELKSHVTVLRVPLLHVEDPEIVYPSSQAIVHVAP